MDRNAELRERSEILDRVAPHVADVGITALTLESAAKAARVTPEFLESYFETKDDLLIAIIARNRIRLREHLAVLDLASKDVRQLGRAMWEFYLANADESKIFFESYGLALHDPHYGAHVHGVNDWIALLRDRFISLGMQPERAEALATLSLAVYRGAMLDYYATGERPRLNAAMELWYEAGARLFGVE
jgi:AcrR family transcriptional regulator